MGFFTPLFAPVTVVLAVLFGSRSRPPVAWMLAWCLFALATAVSAATSRDVAVVVGGGLQAGVAIIASATLAVSRRHLAEGLAVGLGVAAVLLVAVQFASPWSWSTHAEDDAVMAWLRRGVGLGETSIVTRSRSWVAPRSPGDEGAPASISIPVRLLSGAEGWAWWWSGSASVEPLPGEGADAARATFVGRDDPYVERWSKLRERLAGRTFTASVEVRADDPATTGDCRGLRLQVLGNNGGSACTPLPSGTGWVPVNVTWTVPENVRSRRLRVVMGGFHDEVIDLRAFRVEERLADGSVRPLDGFAPEGMEVVFAWRHDTGRGSVDRVWILSELEGDVVIPVPDSAYGSSGTWTVTLRPSPGTQFAVGGVRWQGDADVVTAPAPVRDTTRPALLSGHANVLGHGSAVAALTVMAFVPTASWPFLLASASGLVLPMVSGGRTATAAMLIGAFLLLLLRGSRSGASWIAKGAWVIIVAIGILVITFRDVLPFNVGGLSGRVEIWRGAWNAFLAVPWRGLVGDGTTFTAWWSQHGTTSEVLAHGHNQVLDLAAGYGVLGGVAALSWFVVSVVQVTKRRWWDGGAVILVLVMVSLFDATLLNAFILIPWIMLLVARDEPDGQT